VCVEWWEGREISTNFRSQGRGCRSLNGFSRRYRLPRPVPGHAVQCDCLTVGHHVLVSRVVDVPVRVAGLRLLDRGRLAVARRLRRFPVLVARYAGLVRVLAFHAVRVHVTVLAAGYTVHANCLLLKRTVVVLEAPSDATVRVVVSVPSQHL